MADDGKREKEIDCCVVGGGPAGMVLALLLARQGISVQLLELHRDFDREFRGDTLHPSVMEIMEQLGLAEKLLALPHTKLHRLTLQTEQEAITVADFSHLNTQYPFITVLPQVKFLELLAEEAQQYPNFQLVMGANVQELLVDTEGTVTGVVYRGEGGQHEVRAKVTVGADGRFSRVRQLAGLEAIATSPPMDVLWFRLPRTSDDPQEVGLRGRIGQGQMMAILERHDRWQLGYVILKGSYQALRQAGIEQFHQAVGRLAPEFRERVQQLHDWSSISFLSVKSDRLKHWSRPGLLLIGDAAHIMSPVGGVGINYAIQDAVAAANVLGKRFKAGEVRESDLAKVQQQREFSVRVIQQFQSLIQQQIIKNALNSGQPFKPPLLLRLPVVRNLVAELVAFGISRVRLQQS